MRCWSQRRRALREVGLEVLRLQPVRLALGRTHDLQNVLLRAGLRRRFDANPNDSVVGDYAELLLGWSLLAEGSEPHDPVRFTQLVAGLMETGLDAAPSTPAPASAASDAPSSAESGDAAPQPAAASDAAPADAEASPEAPAESAAAQAEEESTANAD